MLVLLIVFMVTAPLLTVGVPVDLPKSRAQSIADPDEPLVISVNAEGQIYLQDSEVELSQLVPRLRAITESKPRSEEHTSELQSLMRISYAVFCLKKKKITIRQNIHK